MIRKRTWDLPTVSGNFWYNWIVPEGALAGMVGPINVRVGKKNLLVTIDPNDLSRLVVIPRPSRNSALKEITANDRKSAQSIARDLLLQGRTVSSAIHDDFRGHLVIMDESGNWSIDTIPWEKARKVRYKLCCEPVWPPPLKNWALEAVWWVAARIGGYEPLITMPRVSRTGGGINEALTGIEGEAYRLMRTLSKIYPDALWPSNRVPFAFNTTCVPLRLELRKKLLSASTPLCHFPKFRDTRELRSIQVEALDGMLLADQNGMGNFLWMLVGSGKTLTVLKFIDRTRRTSRVLWCLPKSAVRSVLKEIERVGWVGVVLVSSKGRLRRARDDYPGSVVTTERTMKDNSVTLA